MQQVSHLPRNRSRQQVSIPAIVVGTILLIGLLGMLAWKFVLHPAVTPGPDMESGAATINETPGRPGPLLVRSGREAFSVVIPGGWSKLQRLTDDDRLVLAGTTQPIADETKVVDIEDVTAFEATGPLVLDIRIANQSDVALPRGQASDLDIGSGRQLLSGKKYINSYDLDGQDAYGNSRKQGDLDYVYTFGLGGGRELRVTYSVYAADERDQSQVVDELVRSIRKLK